MAAEHFYLRLRRQIEGLWPASVFPLPDLTQLDQIWIRSSEPIADGDRLILESALIFETTLELGLPSLDALTLSVGTPGTGTEVEIIIDLFPAFAASLGPIDLAVNVRSDLLRPVQRVAGNAGTTPRFEIIPNSQLSIPIAEVLVSFDHTGNITVESDYSVSLPPVMIGSTGIVIEADTLRLVLSDRDATAVGVSPAARGLFIDGASVYLPEALPVAIPNDITIQNCIIGPAGITGRFEGHWTPTVPPEGDLFGVPFGLESLVLEFVDNVPVEARLEGQIILPYFDETVDLTILIDVDGNFTVSIAATDDSGIVVKRDELLELTLRSLSFGAADGVAGVTVTGGLRPLLMGSDGLEWPQLDVTDLSIDSTGKFTIKEAWLDLKELAQLDLWGFHFELRRIGIGYEDTVDKLWIDLSGGLRLIEQIPVALDVEGFRIKWPRTLLENATVPIPFDEIRDAASQLEVSFAGIYLFFGVPDAVEFEGLIRFFKDAQLVGFAGDVALRVPASGFAAEAGLLIGLSFEPLFPFLYVYFGVELPAGIPLGQSGLALKGALGMFGLNVKPDKTPEQNWYYDWYKRGPIVGAHPTNKWVPQQDALALGVGVTITTADGYVKGTRGLIVLAIPGPILIIEGRALILNGLQPNAEPPLRALAVFDGGAGTVQFNVEAEATLIADLLKAYGMLEAFFDFNDLTNWHLYLGQDTPRDRRIRADILKLDNKFLFKADAYLMIDMVNAGTVRSRMGASISFEPQVPDIDPLDVDFSATLKGDGIVTARPEQFSGELELSASIRLSTFGVSVRLSADADFLTEGPKPFQVGAHVRVKADMPDPLDPVEGSVEFQWQAPELPTVESPLEAVDIHSRLGPLGAGFSPNTPALPNRIHNFAAINHVWEPFAKASPPVEVDAKPIICFKQKMNSDVPTFARHPSGDPFHYDVGLFEFFPTLTTVRLYEHLKTDETWSGAGDDWILIASTDPADNKNLPGVWLVNSDPPNAEAPVSQQVQLWTDNPLALTSRALGSGYTQFLGAVQPGKALAERVLEDRPNLMRCEYTEVTPVCVNFNTAEHVTIDPGECWEYKDLHFCATVRPFQLRTSSAGGLAPIDTSNLIDRVTHFVRDASTGLFDRIFRPGRADTCLFVDGYVNIEFREPVRKVRIVFCRLSKFKETEIRTRVTARRGKRTVTEGESAISLDLTISDGNWQLESDQGFDLLQIIRMDQFAIKEICYTTVAEIERARLAVMECKQNVEVSVTDVTLTPGAYYRLDVTTRVRGELNTSDLPFDDDSFVGQMLTTAYEALEDALTERVPLPANYVQTCFFQTNTPPANLRPYIKWTHPSDQFERFFYGDDIVIQFLRSNLEEMFRAPFALEAQIKDVQGNVLEGLRTTWHRAQSSTLFPEESVWQTHRGSLDWPEQDLARDNFLRVKFAAGAKGLSPASHYQLEINGVGSGWGKRVQLFSSSFTTSKFRSFDKLVSSHSTQVSVLARNNVNLDSSFILDLQSSCRQLARKVWDYERAEVDHRFETLIGGRKGLEDAKLARREAAASHETKFRSLCDRLEDLYFQQLADSLELYVLRERNTAVALWIKSPENLDIRMDVVANPAATTSERLDHVGRTSLAFERVAPTARKPDIIVVPNADGTQVIVLPATGKAFERGRYLLHLTYDRDHGDELTAREHRYDRPIESVNGIHDQAEAKLTVTI